MSEERKIDTRLSELRGRIIRGEFGTSGRIPSVTQLASDWGTTRPAVYEVLTLLQSEGILISKANSFYANPPRRRVPGGIQARFEDFLRSEGLVPVMDDIEPPSLVSLPDDIAALFGQPTGVLYAHRYRRQGTPNVLYRLAENWYPAALAGGDILEGMQHDKEFDVIAAIKAKHGAVIDHAQDVIEGRLPTAHERKELNIVRTAPVLELRRINYTADNQVVMFNKIIMVANYFSLSYDYPVTHWSK